MLTFVIKTGFDLRINSILSCVACKIFPNDPRIFWALKLAFFAYLNSLSTFAFTFSTDAKYRIVTVKFKNIFVRPHYFALFLQNLWHNLIYLLFLGTDSPKAVRKLMSLSEPGKTRRHQPKHSVSSLHTNPSPPTSPKGHRKAGTGHERSVSETAPPVSLSAESSSVAALTSIKKGGVSTTSKLNILN